MRRRAIIAMEYSLCAACTVLALAGDPWPAGAAPKDAKLRPAPAIELGAPFVDNAILQRQMPVPVWGWSKPGTEVTVAFAGQTTSGKAEADGKWTVTLDPLAASATPGEMVITESTGKKVTLKNILVGEVWLASGQSNMEWHADKCAVGRVLMKQIAERVKAGKEKQPVIREAKVTNVYSALQPIEHAQSEWSSNAGGFSGIAYAFAYKLYRELNVPIGILNCSFSSTQIEAWTPRCGFADGRDEYTKEVYHKILETDPATPEHKAAWGKYYQEVENTLAENAENAERVKKGQPAEAISTKVPGNMRGNRDASWMFNARLNPMIPYAVRGAIWNQGYANMGAGFTYYYNLHSMIRGWRTCWNRPDLPVYFHQFYCPGADDGLSLNATAEMRLGTWRARDIPHAGMASQIDITGSVHYFNKVVPGRRLALHALKNQYGRKIVADGPMFKAYSVRGSRLTVEFDHADGGLVVGETGTEGSTRTGSGIANPTIIPNGEAKVTLFYMADKDRVWHRAKLKIDGEKVVLTAADVSDPRGVAYACNGVGSLPNLYNHALLPMTPFIYYDHKLVTRETWPDQPIKVAGVKPDPSTVGKLYEYRKMPLLSATFRDDAVLQAGVPITVWGSAIHDWGYEAKGKAVIQFSFAGVEKTIPVTPGMREWQVTVGPMPASAEPKTMKVTFTIDGELAHECIRTNIVIGDVWYVSAPTAREKVGQAADGMVRVFMRKAKRTRCPRPSRYSVCVSTTPKNRFASEWKNVAGGLAEALGKRIHAKTGKPVGIIYMNGEQLELKHWIGFDYLKRAPSLVADYKNLAAVKPGTPYYRDNVRNYIAQWKKYWSDYIPEMIATRRVPDGAIWGRYPSLKGSVTSNAVEAYNVMVYPFSATRFKGIVFLAGETMVAEDQGAHYGSQLSALANSWKQTFGGADPCFFYTVPGKALAPKVTQPTGIKGKSEAIELGHWLAEPRKGRKISKEDAALANKELDRIIETVVRDAYK